MNDREANRGRGQSNRGRFGFGRRRADAAAADRRVAALDGIDDAGAGVISEEEQFGYFDDASDDELVMRVRQGVVLQVSQQRGRVGPPDTRPAGELTAYAVGEMARRGLETDLREVLEFDAGEPAASWVVTSASTGPDVHKRTFTAATEAVRDAVERGRDPFVREVVVHAVAADSARTRPVMRSGLGQRLRFIPMPDPSSMTLVERDQTVRRLVERASRPEQLSSDQRARIARRIRDLNES